MPLDIGLPQWQHNDWRRIGLYTLEDYAQYFNCVEGNTTLYALPEAQTVLRWRAMTTDRFRFCFKFPAVITHQSALRHCQAETGSFFRCLEPLAERIGEYWLQLPASFGPRQLPDLWHYLAYLPESFRYGVEVRHPAFFARGDDERALNAGLIARGVNRVMLDTRAVHCSASRSPAACDARSKKPRLPVHALCTGTQPIIRFVGADEPELSQQLFQAWLPRLAQWQTTRNILLFIHTPGMGDVFRLLHRLWPQLLRLNPALPTLPVWPEQPGLF